MPRVFISYRRADAAADAGRIADNLRECFGPKQVFLDEGIQGGALFPDVIRNEIDRCDVVLAIIGADWLTSTNADGKRRLDDPNDWVRLELERALERKKRVVPVLVQGAKIPTAESLPASLKELAQHNAREVREGASFAYDINALTDTLGGRRLATRARSPVVWGSGALLIAVIAVVALRGGKTGKIPPAEDFRVQLRVHLHPHFGRVDKAPIMKLRQLAPRDFGTNELLPGSQTGDAEYEYQPQSIIMPVGREQYKANLHREVESGEQTSKPDWVPICFTRKAESLSSEPLVRLTCAEGDGCRISSDDPGWASVCSTSGSLQWLIPTVYAQSKGVAQQAGWEAPSIQSLRRQEATTHKRAFTEFSLSTGPLHGFEAADRMTYALHVNGSPIYIDGLPPDSVPFDGAKGVNLTFGLENLDFSGEHAGFEDIEVTMQFTKTGKPIGHATAHLPYVALRSMPESRATSDAKFEVKWQASYHSGKQDDVYQIFLMSTPQAQEAADLKRRIDTAKLKIESAPVVAVLRPPVERSQSYGVALGVRQPSGQVKFTFDDETSKKLCRGVIQIASTSSLLSKTAFRRDVEQRGASAACTAF